MKYDFGDPLGFSAKGDTVLDALSKGHVLDVGRLPDGTFQLTEGCDNYYFAVLSREQLLDLAGELCAAANAP